MPKNQTLEELKKGNAEAENGTEVETATTNVETQVEAVEESEVEPQQVAEPSDDETEEDTTPAWMQAGDDEPDDDDSFSNSDAANIRRKWKGKLKEVEKEKDSEIDELRAKIAALEVNKPVAANSVSMPTMESCDFDEIEYQSQMTSYFASQIDTKIQKQSQTASQKQAQDEAVKQQEKAINSHYERAAKLAKESNITPEQYQASDIAVRKVVASIPNFGEQHADAAVDGIISMIGDGSEKLMYYVGVNKQAKAKFKDALESDPSGIRAAMLLGEMKATVMQPVKKVSKANKPTTQVQGDEKSDTASLSSWQRKYEKAKVGQERFKIYQEAKKAGFNVHS